MPQSHNGFVRIMHRTMKMHMSAVMDSVGALCRPWSTHVCVAFLGLLCQADVVAACKDKDMASQLDEKIAFVKHGLQQELVAADKRLVLLDSMQHRAFGRQYPTAGPLDQELRARSQSELLEALRNSRHSSQQLQALLTEFQGIVYIYNRCLASVRPLKAYP